MAGLRRNEIDKLPWAAFNWDRASLRVEATDHFAAKSEDSIGEIDLDPEFLALFRGFRAKAHGEFVIESDVPPRPGASYAHYRCERIFARLNKWVRSKAVPSKRPLHVLRKEFGSRVCDRFGIYAASQALRHADIAITSQHYVDKKGKVTVALGHLLVPESIKFGAPVEFPVRSRVGQVFQGGG